MTTPATSTDLHAAGAAYWGLAARRELGRVKHVPQANPNKAIALVCLAGHHGLKALGITFDRPHERESNDASPGSGSVPERPIRDVHALGSL